MSATGLGTFAYTLTVRSTRGVGTCVACDESCKETATHAVALRDWEGRSWTTFVCYHHVAAGEAWTLEQAAQAAREYASARMAAVAT